MADEDRKQDVVSLEEAANQLGTTAIGVLLYLKHAYLRGRETDGVWQVDAASLAKLCGCGTAQAVPLRHSHCGKPGGCGSCG